MVFSVCTRRNMGEFIHGRVGDREGGRSTTENLFSTRGGVQGQHGWGRRTGKVLKGIFEKRAEEGCRRQGLQEALSAKRSSLSSHCGMNLQIEF